MNRTRPMATRLKNHFPEIILNTFEKFFSWTKQHIDPSSVQDTCHVWTQLNDLALHESS